MQSRKTFLLRPRRRARVLFAVFAGGLAVAAAAALFWRFSEAQRSGSLPAWSNAARVSEERIAAFAFAHARAIASGDLQAILVGYGDDALLTVQEGEDTEPSAVTGFPDLRSVWEDLLRRVRIPGTMTEPSVLPSGDASLGTQYGAAFSFSARNGALQQWRSVFRFDARGRIVEERLGVLEHSEEPATIGETPSPAQ